MTALISIVHPEEAVEGIVASLATNLVVGILVVGMTALIGVGVAGWCFQREETVGYEHWHQSEETLCTGRF
jgi:hypothetical protein